MNSDENIDHKLNTGDFASEKHKIKISLLASALEEVDRSELKTVGENLRQNLAMVNDMISFPHVICTILAAESNRLLWDIEARVNSGVLFPREADEVGKRKYAVEMEKVFKEKVEPKRYELADKAIEEGDRQAIRLLKNKMLTEAYEGILRSGIVLIWCSLEVFLRSLWENSLNAGRKDIIKNILKNFDRMNNERNSSGVQGKSISLEYLSKFNYDLSGKLGTALLYKFDFTSLSGMRDAFITAFPKSITIKKAFANDTLVELSIKRNIIVHNSGIIDEEYCSRLKLGKEQIGHKMKIFNDDLSRFGDAVIEMGIKIMNAVSSNISAA